MKIPKTKKIMRCRLCGNNKLSFVFDYGNLFVSNFVSRTEIYKGIKSPLRLVNCQKCHLLQLSHSAPQEIMYKKYYWYRSGITETMKLALKDIYNSVLKLGILKKKDVVLDIGANDGTLLSYFKKNYRTIACEPAKNLQNYLKKNCDYVMSDFWSASKLKKILIKENLPKPKLITAIGMFYDLENPSKFISDAFKALDDNGVFVAQLMCLKSMIDKNDLGNICHEHLEFYTYKSLKYLFEKNGFYIFKIEENNVNGGSFRIFCLKGKKKSITFQENTALKYIKKFICKVERNKKLFLDFLHRELNNNKTFHVYGASTKGNTVLQYFKLDSSKISYASDRSPEKWGKYTIGSGIKIISEKDSRKMNPNYYIVFPYGFLEEFKKREKNWLKKGGKFVVLYPKFNIVS